ncbi:MAG: ABC transporter permease, partial [Candidatus Bathyarchaeia archaeon]
MELGALLISILSVGIGLATPLILAALGELMSQKSGVLNVGLEGYMLMGSMGAYLGAFLTGNPWLGVLFSIIAGLLTSLIMAYLTITLASDQIVCGIGINVLAWGFTSYLVRLSGIHGSAKGFKSINIPVLSNIPFVGPVLFQQSVLTYLAAVLVIVFAIILYRTSFGLRVKAAGEDPLVCDSLGINVTHLRYLCVLLCGAMAGFGGSFYTLV